MYHSLHVYVEHAYLPCLLDALYGFHTKRVTVVGYNNGERNKYDNETCILPGAIHVVGEHGVLEEFAAVDGRLHLFFGDEMVMLTVHLETPGRSGGVRHGESELVRILVEQFAQKRGFAGTGRAAHQQQSGILADHIRSDRRKT